MPLKDSQVLMIIAEIELISNKVHLASGICPLAFYLRSSEVRVAVVMQGCFA